MQLAPSARRGPLARCALVTSFLTVLGCSTSLQVAGHQLKPPRTFSTVYLVSHADESRGVYASLQTNLFQRGYVVTTGPDGGAPKDVDLVVRFTESWSWDIGFYLRNASVLFYDGRTGALVGSAQWKNSTLHGYQNVDKVVNRMLDAVSEKVGLGTAPT